jgi:hypothetical protein
MSYQQQHRAEQDDNGTLYCRICAEGGYPDQPILRLFNGREIIVVDFDTGQKHYHSFDIQHHEWSHFEDRSEVSKWDRYA